MALKRVWWGERAKLAETTKSPEILSQLAHDEDPYVRRWVAENSNCKSETLEFLSHDADGIVRYRVAEKMKMKKITI